MEDIGVAADDIEVLRQTLSQLDELFLLVVVGEFNSGKSTFINALLGQKFLKDGENFYFVHQFPTAYVNAIFHFKKWHYIYTIEFALLSENDLAKTKILSCLFDIILISELIIFLIFWWHLRCHSYHE